MYFFIHIQEFYGKNIAIIDIASFFMAIIFGELFSYFLMINHFKCNDKLSIIVLIIIAILFIVFTFNSPKIGIFKDPITEKYGIIEE